MVTYEERCVPVYRQVQCVEACAPIVRCVKVRRRASSLRYVLHESTRNYLKNFFCTLIISSSGNLSIREKVQKKNDAAEKRQNDIYESKQPGAFERRQDEIFEKKRLDAFERRQVEIYESKKSEAVEKRQPETAAEKPEVKIEHHYKEVINNHREEHSE